MIIYSTVLIIFNILILYSFENISRQFKIEDKSDGIRKFQKNPVPLLGGTLILFNILLIIFLDYLLNKDIIFLIISFKQTGNFLHLLLV